MRRICLTAGWMLLGVAVTQAQYAPGLSSTETSKAWSLSASVRGFYDDNYLTLPKTIPGPNGTFIEGARGSFGVEVSPAITYNHSVEDTLVSASYVYDLHWYQDYLGTLDQTHQFNAKMDHEFSERYKMALSESFVIAQDPGVLDQTVVTEPLRISGDNVRNTATADFTAQLTKLFDVHFGYANSVYAYQENAGDETVPNSFPSYSASLDRMDQTAAVDLRWKRWEETTVIFGYQFEHIDYTSPEDIIFSSAGPLGSLAALYGPGHYVASVRNTDSHFVYIGADQSFSPNLNGSIRVGGEYVDYYNFDSHEISPYIDASLTYQYMAQSTAQVGVKHVHNSTDVVGIIGSSPVLDEESTSVYLSVSHRVNSRFTVAVLGQAQYSTFNGGGPLYNGDEEDFYMLNINCAYHFTPWLTGETGYMFNRLMSALAYRSYARDQFYLGVRATY